MTKITKESLLEAGWELVEGEHEVCCRKKIETGNTVFEQEELYVSYGHSPEHAQQTFKIIISGVGQLTLDPSSMEDLAVLERCIFSFDYFH